ncbi:MAG: 1,4-alpha-glucan branching protein GlgB [Acetatifactor sp.]|nr:1,4-alpha-glucan branching protein GlgB [Acetatifactor sp.]
MDHYNFYTGKEFEAYRYLGAHTTGNGVIFRTFAPSAEKISVIGEFNNWQETPMKKIYDGNFWECTISSATKGMRYKYRIYKKDNTFIDHADPYAFYSELRPNTASIIYGLSDFSFQDEKWLKKRKKCIDGPINIYELHFGSWRQKNNDTSECYLYAELADILIPYLKENAYNFVEIMPLGEYPCDESWGYQATGFFSPTSRYGEPDGLRKFIDQCHMNQIGVILDFVPVHFALDDYALKNYDGTPLYEYPHSSVGYNEWGSCNFMHSRGEVCSFLQSSAYYWLKEFHFDGLRMDAVGNLIYWQGNKERGENKSAITFLQNMNAGLKKRMADILLYAEDSSSYPGVTLPVSKGGLGFDFKWDMGWMNDTLSYFQSSPKERTEKYHKITFSMHYFYNEKYILPLSHDEVVHGKATIVQKMNGEYEQKFQQAKALYLYMFAHPGKKLNFMGNELGQLREWDEKKEQDWNILNYPVHDAFHHFMQDLNKIYLSYPALSKLDYVREGFSWIDCKQEAKCIYIFERRADNQRILALFNLSDKKQTYEYRTNSKQQFTLLIASDMECYGGQEKYEKEDLTLKGNNIKFQLSPFSGRYYLME